MSVRALHLAATMMLVGAVIFHNVISTVALARARNTPDQRAIARWTQATAWISLAVALVSGAAWVVVLAARISGDTTSDTLSDAPPTLLTQTQFGRATLVRLAIAVLLAAVLAWQRSSDRLRWIAVALALGFAGGLAWMGHSGAGDGLAGDVQVIADALHLIAAATWVGCLVPLAYLFIVAARTRTTLAPAEIADATRRFSNLGLLSVAVLLITGLFNTVFLVGTVAILIGSAYGQVLMIKVILFVLMVCIAAVNRTWLTPAITANVSGIRTKALHRLARNSLIEASLGLAIIAIVGALGTLAPELPEEHDMHLHGH